MKPLLQSGSSSQGASFTLPGPTGGSALADGSTKVVYAALAGNLFVAVSKFGAAALSGSSAMLTEAVHSTADCINQVLLLIGNRRSRLPPDESHPFGYGAEIYFWTSMVAVMVLIAGGVASVVEGVAQLRHQEPIRSPVISVGALALAAMFESASLGFGLREARRVVQSHPPGVPIGLFRFIRMSKDPNLYESLLEDSAAVIGVGIAALGVIGNAWLGLLWADGAASIGIGLLLALMSWLITESTRRLIAGEPVAFPLRNDLERALRASKHIQAYSNLRTLHLGPKTIMVTLSVSPHAERAVEDLKMDLDQLDTEIRAVDLMISYIFFRLN